MNTECLAESDGFGHNHCKPCGRKWRDEQGDRCGRFQPDARKFLITDVTVTEVRETSVPVSHFVKKPIWNVEPIRDDCKMLEARQQMHEDRVLDLEYFTGQENGQSKNVYIGYTEAVEGTLGFMFSNFKKQREATETMRRDFKYSREQLADATHKLDMAIATETRIKNAGLVCRTIYALTGDTKWIAKRKRQP